jgi:hypothetical protein
MTDQTSAPGKDELRADVHRRVSDMLRGMGMGLFPFLDAMEVEHRIVAVGVLRAQTGLDAQTALLMVIDPMAVGEALAEIPGLSLIIDLAAAQVDTPRDREGILDLLADAQSLVSEPAENKD